MSGKKAADDDMIFVSNRKLCNTLLLFLADIKYYYFRLKPRVSTHNSTLVTLLKVNMIVFTRNFRFLLDNATNSKMYFWFKCILKRGKGIKCSIICLSPQRYILFATFFLKLYIFVYIIMLPLGAKKVERSSTKLPTGIMYE